MRRGLVACALLATAACGSVDARPQRPSATPSAAVAPSAIASAPPPAADPPRPYVTLPPGPATQIERAVFSADGTSVRVVRAGSSEVVSYSLATGARIDTSGPDAEAAPEIGAKEESELVLKVGAAEKRTLLSVAKEIGATTREGEEGAVTVSKTGAVIGTDGAHFFWFEGRAGTTLVRLDNGARGTFNAWTTGMSGLGQRTGGILSFAFGPTVDRAIVASSSQMGANVAMDEPRLLDTRTMKVLGSLPGTCQPFAFTWSPRASFVARQECWNGRLSLSDASSAALERMDEPLYGVAFSSDESLLLGRTWDGGLLVEHTKSGEHVLRLPSPTPTAVADVLFSPDGKRLIVHRGIAIDVWDLESGDGRTLDTHALESNVLVTDADATAAWIDARWFPLAGPAPTAPPASPVGSLGAFNARKLANRGENYEVTRALARPGTHELLIVGRRTETISVQDETGETTVGHRIAVVDTKSASIEHVFDDETLDESDWTWTDDGASLITRQRSGALAVLSADLRLQPTEHPILVQPEQPLQRLVRAFGSVVRVIDAAEALSRTDVAPIESPRAIHPSMRLLAFAVGPDVVVVDRSTGAKLRLSCAEIGLARGCLAATEDGRFAATAAIAPLLVREGETREQPDLVRTFFAEKP
ncbi:MAG: WD40 repeat domain-containing protein [Polyangiaceae bacterium]